MAEMYADAARVNYERDGELAPILVLHSEKRAMHCLMYGDEDMPAAYGRTLAVGAAVFKPDYVLTVTEVWQKSVHYEGSEAEARAETDKVRRGDLSRAAQAGDPSVRTALMTVCWTLDPRDAYSIIDSVQDDKTYDRITTEGEQEGWMIDCVMGGWKHALTVPPPPIKMTDELIAQLVAMNGDVAGVMFSDY
jgi:hypothetical protein